MRIESFNKKYILDESRPSYWKGDNLQQGIICRVIWLQFAHVKSCEICSLHPKQIIDDFELLLFLNNQSGERDSAPWISSIADNCSKIYINETNANP